MRQCAADPKIRDISAQSVGKTFSDLVNEITLITGLKIEDQNAKPFAVLFSKFLLSYYGMISSSEVALAFRLNAVGELPEKVDFFGVTLTIEHIGRVLYQYIRKRGILSNKLREQREVIDSPPPSLDQIDMDDKLFVNEYYRKYLCNEFSNITLEYAYMVYDSLDKRGMINLTNAQKRQYMQEAQEMRDKELALPPTTREERKKQHSMMEKYLNDALPAEEIERVKRYAKRMAVLDQFKKLKADGKAKIFEV